MTFQKKYQKIPFPWLKIDRYDTTLVRFPELILSPV